MPPRIRYSREDVVGAAYEIARETGIEAVNARSVAARLGCSTQPLFREFSSMDQIRDEVLLRAWRTYSERITAGVPGGGSAYKASGRAYIKFAQEEPELFRLLFMRDRLRDDSLENGKDDSLEFVISTLMQRTGFDRQTALAFHTHLWVFVHGAAVMVATHYVPYDQEKIERLMSDEFQAMLMLYRSKMNPGTQA